MAKSRYGKKSGRKSAKRVSAGRKAWRTRVRRYGSKAAAIRASFGRKGRGKSRGSSRRRGGVSRTHRVLGRARRMRQFLAQIQKREGTTGLAPTAAEVRLARIYTSRLGRGVAPKLSAEARHRASFASRLSKEKRREAARRVAYDARVRAEERRRAEHDAKMREHESAISAEMGRL